MKTTNYYGTKFKVNEKTLEITANAFCKTYLNTKLNRYYVSWITEDGTMKHTPRARIICQAFHPNSNYKHLQADHIDCDTTNDNPENLRWLTRKQNNSTEHSLQMRSKNAKCTSHLGEVIKATNRKTEEVKYFQNGKHAAEVLGCSSPLIYMVLNENNYQTTAKGWHLQYIKTTDMPDNANVEKRTKDNAMTLQSAKRQLAKTNERISVWKKHLAAFDAKQTTKRESIECKIADLELRSARLEKVVTALENV